MWKRKLSHLGKYGHRMAEEQTDLAFTSSSISIKFSVTIKV